MTTPDLTAVRRAALAAITSATSLDALEQVRLRYLGRSSVLAQFLRSLKNLSLEERRTLGSRANELRAELEHAVAKRRTELVAADEPLPDLTVPGLVPSLGHPHPLSEMIERIEGFFTRLGYDVVEGTEVETERYNFDLLNVPKDHPARDQHDTFYLKGKGLLLRTHTSPMQLRYLEHHRPPIRVIVPGRVYRHEATDASHEAQFAQCEGLVIDRGIRVTDLIGTLEAFLKDLFGSEVRSRVRPHFYPFVEPGMDIDMSCLLCGGRGCSLCGGQGWLEMLGSGMVHPTVLKNMRVDPTRVSGFAFGMGVDRLMLLSHGIDDIRLPYSGDLRFLEQFSR